MSHPPQWLENMSRTPCEICRVVHGPKQAHVFPRDNHEKVFPHPVKLEAARKPTKGMVAVAKDMLQFSKASTSPIATEAQRQIEVVANARTRDAARLANVDNSPTTYRHRDPEKRRAYMRGLMTRRRAARRALRAGGKA